MSEHWRSIIAQQRKNDMEIISITILLSYQIPLKEYIKNMFLFRFKKDITKMVEIHCQPGNVSVIAGADTVKVYITEETAKVIHDLLPHELLQESSIMMPGAITMPYQYRTYIHLNAIREINMQPLRLHQ